MNKVEWKYVFQFLKAFAKEHKLTTFSCLVVSILGAIRPYISIVFMGFLLDAVYDGESYRVLLRYVGSVFGANLLLTFLEARFREWFNQKNEYLREIEAKELNQKALVMDYEYLEEPRVQELRFRSQAEGNYMGTIGWLLWLSLIHI